MASDKTIGAMVAKFEATAALTAVFGSSPCRVYVSEAPENTDLPLCVIQDEGATFPHEIRPSSTATYPYIEERFVNLVVYAVGLANAETYLGLVETAFDFTTLTFPTVTNIQIEVQRMREKVWAERERTHLGKQVYAALVGYRVEIIRSH